MDSYSIAATAIVGLLVAILGPLVIMYLRKHAEASSVELRVSALQKTIAELEQNNLDLQTKNAELQSKITKHEDEETLFADCRLDNQSGVWINESSQRFCPRCKNLSPPKKSLLRERPLIGRTCFLVCPACNWPNDV